MDIRFSTHDIEAGRFHCVEAGSDHDPLLICLHGFPESWLAWEAVMPGLSQGMHVVAPDQRGFNLSPNPAGVDAYHARYLVKDIFQIADIYSPDRPFVLMGHDWGSAVAYAMAFSRPERISHLVVANGVHPWCFQNAIIHDQEQRKASQYINRLRQGDAEALLSANDYEKLMKMMSGFSSTDWLTPELADSYRAQWRREGVLDTMLNWYRASPVVVPEPGEMPDRVPLLEMPKESFRIHMPHLVLWGRDDSALRPCCIDHLDDFCEDLTVTYLDDASHWILHEKPAEVVAEVLAFLAIETT